MLEDALRKAGEKFSGAKIDRLYGFVRQLEMQKIAANQLPPGSPAQTALQEQIARNLEALTKRFNLTPEQLYPEDIRQTYLGS